MIIPQYYLILSCVGCLARQQQENKVHREPSRKQNLVCVLSCFVPGEQSMSAVLNASSQIPRCWRGGVGLLGLVSVPRRHLRW